MAQLTPFQRYQTLKQGFTFSYRGYDLQGILAGDLAQFAYGIKQEPLTWTFIKSKLFFSKNWEGLHSCLPKDAVVFTFDGYGKDYENLLQQIMTEVPNALLFQPKHSVSKRFSIRHFILALRPIFFNRNWKILSFKERLQFYVILVHHLNTILSLENSVKEVNTQKFVPFLSCLPVDSILCHFFRKHNVPSYGIQHGLHCAAQEYPGVIPYDVINLENLQADYVLAWGTSIKKSLALAGHPSERFLLAGAPKYAHIREVKMQPFHRKSCIVALARDTYWEGNLKLLRFIQDIEALGINVYVKFHPRSDQKLYAKALESYAYKHIDVNCSLVDSISLVKPGFAIVYNSTVYYEYYLQGIVTLRYAFALNDTPFGLEDTVESIAELEAFLSQWETMEEQVRNQKVAAMVEQFCALGVNNYKSILTAK